MLENTLEKKYEENVLDILRKHSDKDLSVLIKDIMRNKLEKTKDLWEINEFFNTLYDDLYYDIIFKKIKIDKRTSRLLESLAMPIDRKSDEEWQEIIKKILRPNK
jgi:hypothetical protein